jgi:xanthine/CO dehydrogenase XdhC/CoxF family maturation factor
MKELTQVFEARHKSLAVPHVVATVLRVEGSSYRRPGARMLVNVHGRVAGSVSGGCLEKSVISQARIALMDGQSRLISFDTTDQDDLAFGSSLGCNGKIWIGLEVLPAGDVWPLEKIVQGVLEKRQPVVLLTRIFQQGEKVYFETESVSSGSPLLAGSPLGKRDEEIENVFLARKTRFVGDAMDDAALIEYLAPPVSLILLGGGPDVPPLVKLAREVGHEVTVIDRRPDFAVADQFPGAHRVLAAQPHQIAANVKPDDLTVAVVMNHHYETDRDVLRALLPLGLPYVAMLGPRRRTDRILKELEEQGLVISDEMLASLHAPAGLDLGAETPEQIALAILAEIQATLTGRDGNMLKNRLAPIHVEPSFAQATPCVNAV